MQVCSERHPVTHCAAHTYSHTLLPQVIHGLDNQLSDISGHVGVLEVVKYMHWFFIFIKGNMLVLSCDKRGRVFLRFPMTCSASNQS